ncbi:MAG: hypothetical protein M3165_04400 [Actinomycetota bacterium]|nr:hypothetical protein [Actinomycetota bacterium]
MFIQIIQGKCTKQEELKAALDRWREECEPGALGYLGGTYGFTDDDTFCAVVRFETREAARMNSARPEQGRWWEGVEPLFDGPVEFHDCDDVLLMMQGGSDDAGFVQVIKGRVRDPQRLRSTMDQVSEILHRERPEIIGATIAIEPDGHFIETVAFTDEAAARAGESKEMPAELSALVSDVYMEEASYLDLHHPWFTTHAEGTQSAT